MVSAGNVTGKGHLVAPGTRPDHGRNSYDPVEILAKKLRKLNETNILVITILESQKLS